MLKSMFLKCTNLNYRLTNLRFKIDFSIFAPITYTGWISCLISFVCGQSSCQEHGTSEHYEMKNSCPQWDSNPCPTAQAFESTALSRISIVMNEAFRSINKFVLLEHLAAWIRQWTRKLGMPDVGSNNTVAKKFSLCNFRLLRDPGSSTGPIQMKSSITFIQGKRS